MPVNFKQKINIKSVANFKWTVFNKGFFLPQNKMSLPKKKSVDPIMTMIIVDIYKYIHIHVCMHINTYIHKHTHTHTPLNGFL